MRSARKECRMARRELSIAAGGAEDSIPDAVVQAHVDGCAECRAFARDCVALAALSHASGDQESADEALVMRLAQRGRAQALEPRSFWESVPRWTLPAISASLSAAAVILVLGLQGPASVTRPRANPTPKREPRKVEPTQERPVQALDRLAALLVVQSTTAVETTIPFDIAALRERALVRRLRGDAGNGSPRTEQPRSKEVIHEQR